MAIDPLRAVLKKILVKEDPLVVRGQEHPGLDFAGSWVPLTTEELTAIVLLCKEIQSELREGDDR